MMGARLSFACIVRAKHASFPTTYSLLLISPWYRLQQRTRALWSQRLHW